MSANSSSGWNRPRESAESGVRSAKKAPSQWRGIAAGLAIAVPVVALCLWLFSGGDDNTAAKIDKERGRIKEVTPAAAPKSAKVKKERIKPKNAKDALENISYNAEPLEVKPATKPVNYRKYTNQVFRTGVEQLMSWVFTTEPGEMPIPLPNIEERERDNLIGILISPNPVKEGDNEVTAAVKGIVENAKKEMMRYLKQGGDPDDFMQYYNKELFRMFNYRNDATTEYQRLIREDPDIAEDFRKAVNAKFAADGIKALPRENAEGAIVNEDGSEIQEEEESK